VYNPSGFGYGRAAVVPADAVPPNTENPMTANAAIHRTGRGQQQRMRDDSGSVIEYGLAHASCPVVVIFPRCKSSGARALDVGHSNQAAIAGFSGVVSYRLAVMAVASILNEIR